jgi:peroxiredoxin
LVQLRDNLDEFKSFKLQIVGLSFDGVDVLKKFSDEQDIPFPLLSDEGSQTIHQYELHFQRGLPHPATLVIGTDGVVRAKLMKDGYVDRHSIDELLKAAEAL